MPDLNPDHGMRFVPQEDNVKHWADRIKDTLSSVERVTDEQYVESYVRLELELHQGADWKSNTDAKLKHDFSLYVNFITPV